MRAWLLIGALVTVLFTVVWTSGTVNTVLGGAEQGQQAQLMGFGCNAAVGPWQGGNEERGSADASRLNQEQREIAALIISIGKQREIPPLGWQVAIQAGMTESGLRNLNYGDRDSLGIFQMRPSMNWGSPSEVTDPVYAINKFYDVLQKVPNWQERRPGDVSQAVERSAFPDRYHRWEPMAASLISGLGQITDPTGCGRGVGNLLPPSQAAGTAIQYALAELGEEYVWGATGPDTYDCSGLVLRAFESAGITVPRVSQDQYAKGGAFLPVRDAQPGDLLFWATDRSDPNTVHHVAIYLGDGKYVHAPQTGDVVKISNLNWDDSELMPQAVRPGV
ncbi:C40 family peptidase [Goodfellowiella coeruleoviolacea]|uniref:C40 family peptidase n=1 Tax=Goodfellowiella coeruleoviolacea TaxID=334858 RepID=UPI0038993931